MAPSPDVMRSALVGALAIAAVSTLGDFVWAGLHLRHRMVFGLAHGTLLVLCIGAYLGVLDRRTVLGAVAGAAIGLSAAAAFYLLAPIAGYAVMFLVWACLWCALGILRRWLHRETGWWTWGETLTRSAMAMAGASAGFYLISGIWRPFNPVGWDYVVHFLSWSFAYLLAFVPLIAERRSRRRP